jgi:hypothetical protein
MVFNSPRYVSNTTLHEDSKILFVEDEIKRMTNKISTKPHRTLKRTSETTARPTGGQKKTKLTVTHRHVTIKNNT